ncbi:MAG TPA: hypothetical protein VNP73_06575 [Actinomycetota bacterium]|nr:hypothetical protein [Actinomycetota bacterium]
MREKIMAAVISISVAGFIGATPAVAGDHTEKTHRGHGKRAMGTIESFDGTTLSVALDDTTTWSGPVACDVKVRVEHRGRHARGKGHGNPSRGSVTDLKPGAWILRMKLDDGIVEKVHVRPAPTDGEMVTAASGASDDCDSEEEESDEAGTDTLRDENAKEEEDAAEGDEG